MTYLSFYTYLLFWNLPRLAFRLKTGGALNALFLYIRLVWFLFTRKAWMRGRAMNFKFCFDGLRFTLALKYPVDIAPLVELYVDGEYTHIRRSDVKTIIDLGANYGDSAIYLHACYPQARIYAVEPSPTSFERLKAHVAPFPEIVPIQGMVGGKTEEGTLYLNGAGALGNSMTSRDAVASVAVQSYTLGDLLHICGVEKADIIKFDIEGAEDQLFGEQSPAYYASMYIGEVHEDLMGVTKENFLNYFKDFTVTVRPLKNKYRSILVATTKPN